MTRKQYFLLYFISAVFFSILTLILREPGYMDAEYYYAGGIQIAAGNWKTEPYIWNYLNGPVSLPTVSFSYWMPFSSLLAAAGMKILGSTGFYSARLFFVLLAGVIPVLAAWFAQEFYPVKGAGWLAGCAAIFSVYYLPYLINIDSFTPLMLMGGIFIFSAYQINLAVKNEKPEKRWIFLLGLVTGLIHLTRADGAIWFVVGVAVLFNVWKHWGRGKRAVKPLIFSVIIFAFGYLLIMAGWYIRNLIVFQSIMPPGNGHLIWATDYDDLFFYNAQTISPDRFWASGLGEILFDRVSALWNNVKSLLGVNGSIILVPFIAMGIWRTRKHFITQLTLVISAIVLLVMSLVFPYAGYRGGYFHSNSAIQVIFWGLVPIGLQGFIDLGVKYRKWIPNRSWKMFGAAIIATVTVLSVVIFIQKVNQPISSDSGWNGTLNEYKILDEEIIRRTGDEDSVIMVNDPPGYYLAANRMAIVNPSDGIQELLTAADQFGARFVILTQDNRLLRNDLDQDKNSQDRLKLLFKLGSSEIYEIYDTKEN